MNDKWWDGLTPEGIQNTTVVACDIYILNREIQIRDERIEELEHKLKQERIWHEISYLTTKP